MEDGSWKLILLTMTNWNWEDRGAVVSDTGERYKVLSFLSLTPTLCPPVTSMCCRPTLMVHNIGKWKL